MIKEFDRIRGGVTHENKPYANSIVWSVENITIESYSPCVLDNPAFKVELAGIGNLFGRHSDYTQIRNYIESVLNSHDVPNPNGMQIKEVIFHDPATIVFWMDGSKTVVKCHEDDIYDPEKGLAMAIAKKALGNHGNYCNVFRKWIPEIDEEPIYPSCPTITFDGASFVNSVNSFTEYLEDFVNRMKKSHG